MFRKLYLKNFKVWGDQLWDEGVELAPVTLLLGTNSAGKTSLLQMLLFLKQTFESPDRHLDLNFGGQQEADLVDLGSFESVVHAHDSKSLLGLGFDLAETPGAAAAPGIEYRVEYRHATGVTVLKSLAIKSGAGHYGATRQAKGGYLLSAPGYRPKRITEERAEARRLFQPERSLTFPPDALAAIGGAAQMVQDVSLEIRQQFEKIAYLGPLRSYPKRFYTWNQQNPGDIGKQGQYAAYALLASANAVKNPRREDEGGRGWLVEKVSQWLKRIGVADSMKLVRQGKSTNYDVVITTQGREANIMDVGFGVSQVLPMLVLAYFVPRGATIVAEQPEIHLHPLAQSALADLMVEVASERKVQFIVETHSEHMFRRLQFLIADEQLARDDCRLYFINRGARDDAVLENLRVDDYGKIENWPENFFGDALGETERQMRRILERMRNHQ